jgi:hypothetical protein
MAGKKVKEPDMNELVKAYAVHQRIVQQYVESSGGDCSDLLLKKYAEIEATFKDLIIEEAVKRNLQGRKGAKREVE